MKIWGLGLLVAAWAGALSMGFFTLWRHAETPGVAAHAHPDWPAQSRLPRDESRFTMVVFAHPQCPCTQATLHELQRVMTGAQGQIRCYFLLERLKNTPANWTHTPLRAQAERVAGLLVREDSGREAQLFGASTSGQTMLYDSEGRLRYEGGLTAARAHEGDNTGEDAVLSLIMGPHRSPAEQSPTGESLAGQPLMAQSLKVQRAPVYGCSFR